jgi:hypothetical protein
MKRKLYALSGVFLIALVIAGLWATKAVSLTDAQETFDPASRRLAAGLSMEEMARGAELIVIGACAGTRTQWIDGRHLVTLATVSVKETMKGAPPETLTVVMPGGIDANRRFKVAVTYPGAPTMGPDEELALFLVPAQDEVANAYAVMGFAQGKFSIARDNTGGKVVTRDMTRAPMQKGPGLTRGNLQAVPLSEFRELVKSYLNK